MRIEPRAMRVEPLENLNRRLRARPAPVAADEEDANDAAEPGWVPDGLAGEGWLAGIRADPGRAGGVALAAIAVLAVLITVFTLARHRPPPVVSADLPPVQPVSTSTTEAAAPPAAPAVVSVVGLVQQPGLVTVAPHSRVADAVSAAGGVLAGADTLGLNLARPVADGEQIVVGIAAPAGRPAALGSSVGGTPESGPSATAAPSGPVNLNSATVDQLDGLPGVGPVTAAAIVAWRAANGRFSSVEQLAEVDGIGEARLEKLRPLVRV